MEKPVPSVTCAKENDSPLNSAETGRILENTETSKKPKPSEQLGIFRSDTDGCLRLILLIDAIKLMPSGLCVYPVSFHEKKDIVVCKDGETIKIYRMHEG